MLPSNVSNLNQEEVMGRNKGNRIYIIRNIITKKIFEGTSKEMVKMLGCHREVFYKHAREDTLYKGVWQISFRDEDVKESDEIPWEKWDEWDRERIRVKKWLKNKGKSKRKIEKTAVSEVT